MESTVMNIHRWLDKETMGYIVNGIYYLVIRQDKVMQFVIIWMKLESILLSEISRGRETESEWSLSNVGYKETSEGNIKFTEW